FNKLVGGMQNRLIDKISFGYSGKLADKRIENDNKQIDEEREVFYSLQKKLNDYKSEHKDELLGKSDLEIGQILEEQANNILTKDGYDGTYQNLIKRAKQWKTSTSTNMPGMLGYLGEKYVKQSFGNVTNAVTGKNWMSDLENDNGDISADNLFNSNLPRVTQKDIEGKVENINKKIKTLQEELSTLDATSQVADRESKQNEIEQLQMQREIVLQQKNTWYSMNNLRETRDKYGVEAMLIRGLGGVAGGAVGGATGAVAGLIAGVAGGVRVGDNLGNDSYPVLRTTGKVLGGVGGLVFSALPAIVGAVRGGVRGANRGAAAGVDGVGAFGARVESVAAFGVNKVGGVSKGLYNFGVNVAFGNDRRRYIANVGSNFVGEVGAIPARARGAGSAFYAGAGNVTDATKVIAKRFASDGLNLGKEVYRSTSSDTSAGTFAVARS
ncbi:MAG: hypothetical protein EBT55_06385, partial [Proteobacteria bacterium]|nr:hypothetical protein [Pseudomonadota bacterium]